MSIITSRAKTSVQTDSIARDVSTSAAHRPEASHRGWRVVGWFGLLFAVIGFADLSIYLIPADFGVAEWEFAMLASAFSSLPLPTIGVAAVVGALLVNRSRTWMIVAAVTLLVLAALVAVGYALFALNLPLALQAAQGPQAAAIYKTIARATIMAVGFGSAYLIAGIAVLRQLPTRKAL